MEAPDAELKGSIGTTPLPQVLRQIFLGGLKGTLRLTRRDEARNFFFEKGELRTATSSREGQKIGAFLKRRGWITDRDLAWALETVARQGRARLGKILVERGVVSSSLLEVEMKRLVEEIVFSTFEWEQGDYRFEPSARTVDADAALSLSTAAIIVEGIRRLPESDAFRQRLPDGNRIPVLAADPMSRYQYLPLTPQETSLLSRVDGVLDLDAILKLGDPSPRAAARTLYALVSCGIVEWKSEGSLPAETLGLEQLNVQAGPPPGPAPPNAEMIHNMYRRIDWLTHYELLGVGSRATSGEIRQAYFERSRSFHPDLSHRPDLADCRKELATIFERLKAAFAVLSEAKERARYDASLNAPTDLGTGPVSNPRAQREIAAKSYARARQLIDERDFYPAIQMLREAIHFVPENAEYRFCLGSVELQNAKWVDQGLENLMIAARLDPKRQEYLRGAAEALHQHGRREEALLFARRALHMEPSPENQELLQLVLGHPEKPGVTPGRDAREEAASAPESPLDSLPGPAEKRLFGFLSRLFRHRA